MTAVSGRGWWLVPPLVVAYLVAALWPFRLDLPTRHQNGFERTDQVLAFDGSSLATTRDAEPWTHEVVADGRFTLHLSVRSLDSSQHGPARILTASRDEHERDLMVGQQDDDLVIRFRRSDADSNGEPALVVHRLFSDPGWHDLELTAAAENLRVRIDGSLRLLTPLGEDALVRWERYPVTLGNERTGTRGWRGEIRVAEVRWSSGTVDYMRSALDVPKSWWTLPAFSLGTRSDAKDLILNLFGFLPLGAVLGALAPRRTLLWATVGALLVSLGMELGQVFTVSRDTSVIDLAVNTAGGAVGGALAQLARRPAPEAA